MCKCWYIFSGLCLKNLLVYYRLKQYIGSISVLFSTVLFLALRLAIQPEIDSKDKLIREAKIDYRRAINEIYGFLKKNEESISNDFEDLIAKYNENLSTYKVCFIRPTLFDPGSFPPNIIKKSVEAVIKENYD
ncbi:MAG: hypothetical protein MHMPM18_003768, partial [Marteilia pararefringens]